MLGPTGIGGLYVKSEILEQMEPFLTGGEMVQEVTFQSASLERPAHALRGRNAQHRRLHWLGRSR